MSRRLRFGWKHGTPHPLMRGARGMWRRVLHWSLSDPGDVVEEARCYFLSRICELRPGVLHDLAAIEDASELPTWASAWGLIEITADGGHAWGDVWLRHEPWVLAYADDTLDLWRTWPNGRGREWSYNRPDAGAGFVPKAGRLPTFRHLDIPRDHFDWLIHAQVTTAPSSIAATARHFGVDRRAIARASRRLAAYLAVPFANRS